MNIFKKFQNGLKKTSSVLSSNLLSIVSAKKINQEILDEIESTLISSDLGLEVTESLIKKIKSTNISSDSDSNFVLKILSGELEKILKPREKLLLSNNNEKPTVIIFIGVTLLKLF